MRHACTLESANQNLSSIERHGMQKRISGHLLFLSTTVYSNRGELYSYANKYDKCLFDMLDGMGALSCIPILSTVATYFFFFPKLGRFGLKGTVSQKSGRTYRM